MPCVYDDGNAFVKAQVHTARKLNVFRIIACPCKIQQWNWITRTGNKAESVGFHSQVLVPKSKVTLIVSITDMSNTSTRDWTHWSPTWSQIGAGLSQWEDGKVRHNTDVGSIPRCDKELFSQCQLSVQIPFRCSCSSRVQSHASTAAQTLRVPNACWTHDKYCTHCTW